MSFYHSLPISGDKSFKNSLGFLTQIPLCPFASSKWWSPLTIVALEASAHSTNLSSSGSSQTGSFNHSGTTLVASSSIRAIHSRGSMRGIFRCSLSETSRYSSIISLVTNHLKQASRHASNTRPGTPPKKMPDIRTFVSSVAFIGMQARGGTLLPPFGANFRYCFYTPDGCHRKPSKQGNTAHPQSRGCAVMCRKAGARPLRECVAERWCIRLPSRAPVPDTCQAA